MKLDAKSKFTYLSMLSAYVSDYEKYLGGELKFKPSRGKNMRKNPEYVDVGRNDPCPCGSGKKYKKCCLDSGRYEKYVEVRSD
jgi:uncharacterized protein YecA (UPF0149 family)